MADLPESADWVDGIYQIETTDPVVGGPPNLALGLGISNVQAQQLAQRTAWLKAMLGGIGGDVSNVADIDALKKSGMYFVPGGATGSPQPAYDGRLIHIENGGEATQIVVMGATYMAFRDKDTVGGEWGAWQRIWHSDYAASQVRTIVEEEYGVGGDAPIATDLDAISSESGYYFVPGGATGSPLPGYDGRLIHVGRTGEATQIAVMGPNYMAFRDRDSAGGAWGDWNQLVSSADVTGKYYSIADAPDTWLIGANFKGDTSVALGAVVGYCHRVGNVAHIALTLDFSGFSITLDDDNSVSTRIDINAIGVAAGWFSQITSDGLGMASGQFKGGWDAPWIALQCTASSVSGTVRIGTGDTANVSGQASDATDLTVMLTITLEVED